MHISTHGIPISVLINYLEQYVENIIFIGIQPKVMSGNLTVLVCIGLVKMGWCKRVGNKNCLPINLQMDPLR